MTKRERVIRFFTEGLKFRESQSASRKYRKFTKSGTAPDGEPWTTYFIGRNGAVRAGKKVSDSVSLTVPVHANMRLWERKNEKED